MNDNTEEFNLPPQNKPEWAKKNRQNIATPVWPREVKVMDVALIRTWLATQEQNLEQARNVPGMSEETIGYYIGYTSALDQVLRVASETEDAREVAAKLHNPPMPGWFPAVVVSTFCVGILMVLGWALFS